MPAKAKNRNRKVPTNSPAMATKWLRGPLGSRLKKGAGRGTGIFSDSEVVCEIPVPFRVRFPKSPGRNPDFAFMFSIMGGRYRVVTQTEVVLLAGADAAAMYPVTVKPGKRKNDEYYSKTIRIMAEARTMGTIARREIREKCRGVAQKDSSPDEALVTTL